MRCKEIPVSFSSSFAISFPKSASEFFSIGLIVEQILLFSSLVKYRKRLSLFFRFDGIKQSKYLSIIAPTYLWFVWQWLTFLSTLRVFLAISHRGSRKITRYYLAGKYEGRYSALISLGVILLNWKWWSKYYG